MDAYTAGRLCRSVDPLHSLSYFLPESAERFGALGMHGMTPYFAVRSAPMGAVSAEVVTATFFNFNPELVAQSIPHAWSLASPETVSETRYAMVEDALPRILGEELTRSPELARAAALLRRAAEAIPNGDGRPLYAGHSGLPWPESVHGQMWHAVTLLREYRGDGHIAALVANGLSGLEALVSHTATGIGFSVPFAQALRGWSEDQWRAGLARLQSRGLIDGDGALTDAGRQLRARVEDLTDELGYAPWSALTDDDGHHIAVVAKRIRDAVSAAKLFPSGAFGPRYGEPR
ncbi:hypothetical protein A5698_24655 [Mycobacterium sp. E136]|uniref:SCO6745 family protein n=1 Tax=Mycobacterium sp. E136 TaxID=1834125 RepID=UPI0007FB8CC8|nr:hypothetical protein [Mycobacterium sp. E136]OBG88262.1 hypothetical protein A5698_24655 [Mycobacterium sp. E136]